MRKIKNFFNEETFNYKDIILVMDVSGSMDGMPMLETKKAAKKSAAFFRVLFLCRLHCCLGNFLLLVKCASCTSYFGKGSSKSFLGVFEDSVNEIFCGLAHFAALLLCLLGNFSGFVFALANNFLFINKCCGAFFRSGNNFFRFFLNAHIVI